MKNILKKFEENDEVQFFVMRSYLYAIFDVDRKKLQYHIFYIKKNSSPDAYHQGYMNLKERKMNRIEIEHFRASVVKYNEVLKNDDGVVYNLKDRGFDRSQCLSYTQFRLNL